MKARFEVGDLFYKKASDDLACLYSLITRVYALNGLVEYFVYEDNCMQGPFVAGAYQVISHFTQRV